MQEKLGQIEYEEVLLDNISKVVINRKYIKDNQSFWDNIVFKLFEEYYFSSEPVSIRKQSKFLEIFFDCNIKFKPSQFLPNDVLDLS